MEVLCERFGSAINSLNSAVKVTSYPYNLVHVDGARPREIVVEAYQSRTECGVTQLQSDKMLAPNNARNIGLRTVATSDLVILDNDVIVSNGRLEALPCCAQETGTILLLH